MGGALRQPRRRGGRGRVAYPAGPWRPRLHGPGQQTQAGAEPGRPGGPGTRRSLPGRLGAVRPRWLGGGEAAPGGPEPAPEEGLGAGLDRGRGQGTGEGSQGAPAENAGDRDQTLLPGKALFRLGASRSSGRGIDPMTSATSTWVPSWVPRDRPSPGHDRVCLVQTSICPFFQPFLPAPCSSADRQLFLNNPFPVFSVHSPCDPALNKSLLSHGLETKPGYPRFLATSLVGAIAA